MKSRKMLTMFAVPVALVMVAAACGDLTGKYCSPIGPDNDLTTIAIHAGIGSNSRIVTNKR